MSGKTLSAFLFTVFLTTGIIFSGYAKQEKKAGKAVVPESLSNPLKIETGYISGFLTGDGENPVRAYRGIPYAAPPVSDLRWKPPLPVAPWKGVRQCVEFTGICPRDTIPGFPSSQSQGEDCLYLNVMTPAKTADEALPVMVYMHGGGYCRGSGNEPLCNLHRLPQHGVVVVTVNMRINTFGLLAHPLLTAESPNKSSGNYMFLDMIAALKWVKRNISAFGGNPGNVTIFGQSGGGSKVSTLMASPLAKGLFHRAICESGSSLGISSYGKSGKTLREMEELGVKFFARLGVDNMDDPLKAARALSFGKILEARNAMMKESGNNIWSFSPDDSTIDRWFLPKTPLELFKSGEYNAVPLITLANLGEITGPGIVLLPYLIPAYVNMQECQEKAGVKGYVVIFDRVPDKWRVKGAVSTHVMEMPYVFGDYDNRSGYWAYIHGVLLDNPVGISKDPCLTETDLKISEAMMKMWTQFARTGDPNIKGVAEWPVYNKNDEKYLYVADHFEIRTGFSKLKPE